MEKYMNLTLIWFIIGFALFMLEFAVPGFILFFFGIAAWIVAVITLFIDISLNLQLMIFLGSALITVALFRKYLKDKLGMYRETPKLLEDEFIGKVGYAETEISPVRNGKVDFKGTSWDASSADTIAPGQQVQIIETKSILLIVKLI
ncbi:MAG: NfeD family protein [Daejeonella sp.]|uniref:NfeD family protein n=1 Tax=Daejeonella sp. TaxID=2805397 RepID=UPI003C73F3BE